VGLQLADAVGADHLDTRHPVGPGSRRDRFELRDLIGPVGHDELAGVGERDAVLVAVGLQQPLALGAQTGLLGARRVVDAGVDDTAVATGLVGRQLGLALEDREAQPGPANQQLARDGDPEDAAADDRDVIRARRCRRL
jgi:hypothetical protein